MSDEEEGEAEKDPSWASELTQGCLWEFLSGCATLAIPCVVVVLFLFFR